MRRSPLASRTLPLRTNRSHLIGRAVVAALPIIATATDWLA
jgi:hypothetical protein